MIFSPFYQIFSDFLIASQLFNEGLMFESDMTISFLLLPIFYGVKYYCLFERVDFFQLII